MIITLQLDEVSQQYFNTLRNAHFPAHANYLDAHLSLFYKLPDANLAIDTDLQNFAQRAPMELQVTGLFQFGQGVAFTLASDELTALHAAMQQRWEPWLIRQDKQPLHPHITIQNKVTAHKATQLYHSLMERFTPFTVQALGLHTWRYLKGPWKPLVYYPFGMV
ncbi:MAG: 2'-5' RNA ligase family protein [Chitinophaga sp.]|uniref:2'-5' RNA ligase family protein n=1 Tax=Chitinophaga sp. TaxID=1869181 RepID=UPI0025BD2143|nr:2'-5' RNA ligase family protein [Chitinophaga sp.]MBV8252137.1 2'-5' RNA ligase family protein [Chitinophaga sp.]